MDVNPYQAPRADGYYPPRQRSRWWDFLACVATAVLVHVVIQTVIHTYRILGWDWTAPLRYMVIVAAAFYAVSAIAAGVLVMWRKWQRKHHIDS